MAKSPERIRSPFAEPRSTDGGASRSTADAEPARIDRTPIDLPLRPLTGWEEEFVERHAAAPNTARLCNEVLARCLRLPGAGADEAAHARVRELLVAERDRALVQLRCMSLGPDVSFEAPCSRCREANRVSFSLTALGLDFRVRTRPVICTFPDGGSAELRLPTAGDQEELFDLELGTAAERKTWLLGRVLQRYRDRTQALDADFARGLPTGERNLLEAAITEALPDFDFRMTVECVSCRAELTYPFDVAFFFWDELRAGGGRRLLRHIHMLARSYHWSERDILSLPLERRLAYLLMLEAENDALLLGGLKGG